MSRWHSLRLRRMVKINAAIKQRIGNVKGASGILLALSDQYAAELQSWVEGDREWLFRKIEM